MLYFIELLLWTSLTQFPNRRAYFHTFELYNLPHFTSHSSLNRFGQLLTMLHFTDNKNIPQDLCTARRFEGKLANSTLMSIVTPQNFSHQLEHSIHEMMVKFYGRSVLRQYIPAMQNKHGIKLWAVAFACCVYSLT